MNDIEVNIRHLERRIELLSTEAVALVREHPVLQRAFEQLTSIPGIAAHSAVQLLPELLVLPEGMTVRQWVAHAGLDPRAHQSGTSVDKPARLSKVGNAHIRRALFMPALATSPPTMAEIETALRQNADLTFNLARNTRLFNYLGLPALAVPCGFADDGLPVAFQVIGRPFAEPLLFNLGHVYQAATDHHRRPPAL